MPVSALWQLAWSTKLTISGSGNPNYVAVNFRIQHRSIVYRCHVISNDVLYSPGFVKACYVYSSAFGSTKALYLKAIKQ